MLEARISPAAALPAGVGDELASIRAMLALFDDLASAASRNIASQQAVGGGSRDPLATRYAIANPIARRRFDALLREAETIAAVGLRLIMGRSGKADAGTIAAARFLGRSLKTAIGRLDALLPAKAA